MKHKRKYDDTLDYFVQKIREQLGEHLKQVILFGSRSRGDDVPGSDYDCLVIVDKVSRTINDTIDELTGEALYQYNALISVILVSEEKFNRQIFNPLLMNVKKEGIAL